MLHFLASYLRLVELSSFFSRKFLAIDVGPASRQLVVLFGRVFGTQSRQAAFFLSGAGDRVATGHIWPSQCLWSAEGGAGSPAAAICCFAVRPIVLPAGGYHNEGFRRANMSSCIVAAMCFYVAW